MTERPSLTEEYVRWAVPDQWAALMQAGVSPADAAEQLAAGVEPLRDVDDYERYVEDVRAH